MQKTHVRWGIVSSSILVIAVMIVAVVFNLDAVKASVQGVYDVLSFNMSWWFVVVSLACVAFTVWGIFGKCHGVVIGGQDAKPAYSKFSWIAIMFMTSCSAGLVLFGLIEPLYYIQNTPFEVVPFSDTAYEYAEMYAHHHWGISIWALYVPCAVAIALMFFNCKSGRMSVGDMVFGGMRPSTVGRKAVGNVIDVLSVFGTVAAPVTSMGLGLPLVVMLIQSVFSIPGDYYSVVQMAVIVAWLLIFGTSVFLGIDKGIKNLSDLNVVLAVVFMVLVAVFTGVFTVFKAEVNAFGLYVQNWVRMATYTDPYGTGHFVDTWTVWYIAWIVTYMPLMGVLAARVSKGRTIREMCIGLAVVCSVGCFFAIATLNNYAIGIQRSGVVDLAAILNDRGQAAAIVAVLQTMPAPKLMMLLLAVVCMVFMATTVDSSSYVAAEMSVDQVGQDPPRWTRMLWAIVTFAVALVLLAVGGFSSVQTLALLCGLPLSVVLVLGIRSAILTCREHGDIAESGHDRS